MLGIGWGAGGAARWPRQFTTTTSTLYCKLGVVAVDATGACGPPGRGGGGRPASLPGRALGSLRVRGSPGPLRRDHEATAGTRAGVSGDGVGGRGEPPELAAAGSRAGAWGSP